jgi:hypothetical protein
MVFAANVLAQTTGESYKSFDPASCYRCAKLGLI